jgi:hypothetical protein
VCHAPRYNNIVIELQMLAAEAGTAATTGFALAAAAAGGNGR